MTLEELRGLPVVELKAYAFDAVCAIENNQKNLQVLNQLIQEKSKPTEPVKD